MERFSDLNKDEREERLFSEIAQFLKFDAHYLSYPQKMGLLKDNTTSVGDVRDYELVFGELIEEVKLGGKIKEWYPTEANGVLDKLGVDFIIQKNDNTIVPLQVTGRRRGASRKRQRIRKNYRTLVNETPLFPVLNARSERGIRLRDSVIKERIITAVGKYGYRIEGI